MMKLIRSGLAVAAAIAAIPASAVTFTAGDSTPVSILFNGFASEYDEYQGGMGTPTPGLTSTLTLALTSFTATSLTFDYTVANTSGAPMDDSRVSGFGFNVSGPFTGATATGEFDAVGSGNVPQAFPDADVCFLAANNANNCTGGAGGGVSLGDAALSGTFTLSFSAPVLGTTLDNLFVRYQTLDSDRLDFNGDSGIGVPIGNGGPGGIPEPATWAMLIAGFGLTGFALRSRRAGVGSAMRRRRGGAASVSA